MTCLLLVLIRINSIWTEMVAIFLGTVFLVSKVCCAVLCLVVQSCLSLCDNMDCSLPSSSVRGDSPGKNTGVGCHALLQRIVPTQGLNPGLLHCRWILYQLSHQGSRRVLRWVAYPFSGDLPNPGIEPGSPALQEDSLPAELPGKSFSSNSSVLIV